MKNDRKYFIENLTCFVSRARQSGGVETIRSFSVTKQLPPLVPTPPNSRFNTSSQPTPSAGSAVSMASLGSQRGSASSGSFGVASSDGFLTQDSDAFSMGAPTTGDSIDQHEIHEISSQRSLPLRSLQTDSNSVSQIRNNPIAGVPRLAPPSEPETGYNLVNRKPALRKWLQEDENADHVPYESSFSDRSSKLIPSTSLRFRCGRPFRVCTHFDSRFQARMGTRFMRLRASSNRSRALALRRASRNLWRYRQPCQRACNLRREGRSRP